MPLVFAVTVLVLNLVLWVLLLARFRGLFDTGDIVDKTREEITEIERDLNRVAQRDIALFNECSKQLHVLLDDADKKTVLLKEAEQKADLTKDNLQMAYTEISASMPMRVSASEAGASLPVRGGVKKRAVNSYKKTAAKRATGKSSAASTFADDTAKPNHQQPLFDERDANININVPALQGESEYIKKNVGPIYLSDSPHEDKTDVSAQVMAMKGSGFSTEQIAERLSCSLTEVQMILDMSLVSGGD